jgi:hypothetical protein
MATKHDAVIEDIMDEIGIPGLFEAVARIASEKQDHVQSTWQDKELARRWGKIAAKFRKLAENTDNPYGD